MTFEVFEHTADIGLRIRSPDRPSLFVDAARSLFSLLVANLETVRCVQVESFAIAGGDDEYLLFDWLNELLYTFETKRILLAEFDVQFDDSGITAVCRGEPIDPARHEMDHEVKAITYHELKVEQTGREWLAEVIVDI
jgi:SHS2 domain-containing protein